MAEPLHPYREMTATELPHERCIGECECTRCGHWCSSHWYFNSEFVRCNHRSIPMIGQECQCNGLDRHGQPLLKDPYSKRAA